MPKVQTPITEATPSIEGLSSSPDMSTGKGGITELSRLKVAPCPGIGMTGRGRAKGFIGMGTAEAAVTGLRGGSVGLLPLDGTGSNGSLSPLRSEAPLSPFKETLGF